MVVTHNFEKLATETKVYTLTCKEILNRDFKRKGLCWQ